MCEKDEHRLALADKIGVDVGALDDDAITSYSATRDKHELTHEFQAVGVPSHWWPTARPQGPTNSGTISGTG